MVIIMIIMVFLEEKRIERTIDDEREWIGARGEEGILATLACMVWSRRVHVTRHWQGRSFPARPETMVIGWRRSGSAAGDNTIHTDYVLGTMLSQPAIRR